MGGKGSFQPYGCMIDHDGMVLCCCRTWQSVTSVDVVEDGQIVGTRGGLPCRVSEQAGREGHGAINQWMARRETRGL